MKRLNLVLAVGAIVVAGFTPSLGQDVSDEARRHFDRGMAAVEMAKTPADYEAAIAEFKQAISLAPDWADAYFNLGKVQEQAEKYNDAITSLRQYLRLAPNANDAETVKSLINKLQFKAENTLTPADIVSVLTSLSKWEAKGDCHPYAYTSIDLKDDGFINVVTWMWPVRQKVLRLDGPKVKYRWTFQQCPSQNSCPITFDEEIEVLSKTRVRVRQVVVDGGVYGGPQIGQKFDCELSPPK